METCMKIVKTWTFKIIIIIFQFINAKLNKTKN
jgi:hypothetical protein